jgi:hypothetical protein
MVLTPLTTNAGEWLYDRETHPGPMLQTHAGRGDWMIYFAVGLLVVAIALAVQHWLEGRWSSGRRTVVNIVVAIFALAVGISSMIGVYRIGDSGAQAVWRNELTQADKR